MTATMRRSLVPLVVLACATLIEAKTHWDDWASHKGYVPDPKEAAAFNAKLEAAGQMPGGPPGTNTGQSIGNGSSLPTAQATWVGTWGWYVYSHLEMGFAGVRGC